MFPWGRCPRRAEPALVSLGRGIEGDALPFRFPIGVALSLVVLCLTACSTVSQLGPEYARDGVDDVHDEAREIRQVFTELQGDLNRIRDRLVSMGDPVDLSEARSSVRDTEAALGRLRSLETMAKELLGRGQELLNEAPTTYRGPQALHLRQKLRLLREAVGVLGGLGDEMPRTLDAGAALVACGAALIQGEDPAPCQDQALAQKGQGSDKPGVATGEDGADGSDPDRAAAMEVVARVWDRATPTDLVGGLESIVSHPTDPTVWWVSDGARVWVTDDGGDSYGLVVRATGSRRSRESSEEEERDAAPTPGGPDERAIEGAGQGYESITDDPTEERLEAEAMDLREGEAQPRLRSRRSRGKSAITELVARVGPRLRLVGDRIYLCGAVGLWSADAAARSLGTDREHRFGRSIPVFDVTLDRHGKRWVATSEGLFVLAEGDRSTPTRGNASRDPVFSVQVLGRYLVGGGSEGLWIGDGHYVVRVGLLSGSAVPVDVLALDETRVAVATGDHVSIVRFPTDSPPRVEGQWPVSGASRIALSSDGKLLAAGSSGLWVEERTGQWTRSSEGLMDRHIKGVAGVAPGGAAISLVVSRSGAFRYISEMTKVVADRGRGAIGPAIEGAPTSRDVVLAGYRARGVSHERVDGWHLRQGLSFLLPQVNLSYQTYRARYTDGILVDALEEIVLTNVRVVPDEYDLRVFASWDLGLIFFANPSFEGGQWGWGSLASETRRVLDDRAEIRDSVVPLHNRWVEARVKYATHGVADTRAELKRVLELQHLEADLHALTSGAFHAPPLPQSSTSRSDQGETP